MNNYKMEDIIRYTDGEMEGQELQDFEAELLHNTALSEDLRLYSEVNSELKWMLHPTKEDQDFKESLKTANAKYFKKEAKIKALFRPKYWYAAAILILGLLIWAPWNTNLYKEYSGATMIDVAERGTGNNELLQKATSYFNEKKYALAKTELQQILDKEPDNDMVKYYLGISALETDDIVLAKTSFEKVYAGESLFKYNAAFYRALTAIKQNNKSEAKLWLRKIPETDDLFEKAQKLFKEL